MNSMNSAILDPRLGWITLAILSALWIWLGWLWGRNAKDLDEYALAGRRVGLALGTATSMATWWSRAFAFREGVGFKAYIIAGILWMPFLVAAGFLALAVPALDFNIPAADMVGFYGRRRITGCHRRGPGANYGVLSTVIKPGFSIG